MAQALEQEMYNCFSQLNEAEKKSVILMLKTFLRSRKENPESISIEQYNKEIEEAEAQFERGEYISNDSLICFSISFWTKNSQQHLKQAFELH